MSDYEIMDQMALEAGTDKSSNFHRYTEVYASYFAPLRDKPIKFLEIGIGKGDSVKLWENYFPKAELHFIDISPEGIDYFSLRATYYFFDQADVRSLQAFAKKRGGQFDIIIDDGGHHMQQQILSFTTLFPYLNKDGLYCIEDLHTSYWMQYGGGGNKSFPKAGQGTTVELLKNLVEDLNFSSAVTGCADCAKIPPELQSRLNAYQHEIYFIHFYKSLCIIKKRP